MKFVREFVQDALIGGVLVVLPIYLAFVVLLKGMRSVVPLVRPFTMLLPAWVPAENLLSLVLVLLVCFLIGVAVRTRLGQMLRERSRLYPQPRPCACPGRAVHPGDPVYLPLGIRLEGPGSGDDEGRTVSGMPRWARLEAAF